MRYACIAWVVAAAGCGKIGFDPVGGGDDDEPLPVGRWAQVSPAYQSTCAITTGGELWCWGLGIEGVIGVSSAPELAPPTRVGDQTDWTHVSVYGNHACALRNSGELWCWGWNQKGALGTGPVDQQAPTPVRVTSDSWTTVDTGQFSTCAIRSDATLWCWGHNAYGQLGDGSTNNRSTPTQVGNATWLAVDIGEETTCGIQSDRSLWCWGNGETGQRGDGTNTQIRDTPRQIGQGHLWSAVSVAYVHACAIEADGSSWCWGSNYDGKLGLGTTDDSNVPMKTLAPPLATLATTIEGTTCGTTPANELYCWGSSVRGQIAGVESLLTERPLQITQPSTSVAMGGATTCVIDPEHHLFCTGANSVGQAGQPAGETHGLIQTDERTDWTSIAAFGDHACGTIAGGDVLCWGAGGAGQVGDGEYLDRQLPVETPGMASALALGHATTIGIAATAELWVTGYDPFNDTYREVPTTIAGGTVAVGIGYQHACRLTSTGEVRCSGSNRRGQLGDGTTNDGINVVVPGTWQSIAAGSEVTCAYGIQGGIGIPTLHCWGAGDLAGSNASGDLTQPTAVTSLPNHGVPTLAMGDEAACAIDGGELWCWGANDWGQLGVGDQNPSQTPARVGARSDWMALAAGDVHFCGITSDGALWCWGHADQGQGYEPVSFALLTPRQVGTGTSWVDVAAGSHFTCALANDGTRWCFGANPYGQIGNGRSWLTSFAVVP